jgi:hypothetical protein
MVSSRKKSACKENNFGYKILFGWVRPDKNPAHS